MRRGIAALAPVASRTPAATACGAGDSGGDQADDGPVGQAGVFEAGGKHTFAAGPQRSVSEHDTRRHLMAATAVLVAIPVSAFFSLVQKNLVTA